MEGIMSEPIYEHHLSLKQDRLCPFKFNSTQNVRDSVCNWHSNIEILIVTDGNGHMQYNSDDLTVAKGDILVINSGDLHHIYSDSGISFEYLIVDEKFCRENGINTVERYFHRLFKCAETERIYECVFRRYKAYKADGSPINTALLRMSVLELLTELYLHHSEPLSADRGMTRAPRDFVKKVIEYLAEHYTESLTLEEVATVCGITKFHLAREFKRYTGQTVITYINVLRCKKARVCLSDGMTVTEAAVASGFEGVSYFSRTYKKIMGVSPLFERKQRSERAGAENGV